MLRLIPFTKTNNILIKNNKGRVVKFKEYLTRPETWTINDLKAHDQQVKESRKESNPSINLEKGEIEIFHGGSIKSVKEVKGFAYFSENKNQAEAYAKGNQGEVKSFVIDKTSIATESQVIDVINALGIKPRNGWKVDESHLYELIDPRFEQSFSKKDREKLAVALKKKGIKAARFTDVNIAQGKDGGRETANIQ